MAEGVSLLKMGTTVYFSCSCTQRLYLMREISRQYGLDTLRQLGDQEILRWVIPDHARPKPVSEPNGLLYSI